MNILAIDIGTYSIKFLELKTERKNIVIVDKNEVVIEDARPHYPSAHDIKLLQKEIVSNYILKKPSDTKIIFQIPNESITTRYLEIPGTSKRKTEQIIPFQLDENLPYSLQNAHFSSRLIKKSTGFSVISNITQLQFFKDFFNFFENKEADPSILTSELSTIQSYIDSIRFNERACILDIGHRTTKAYFIQDRKIVANHTSYIAGLQINELISKTYQISQDEAILYKHDNAFFLTDDQIDEVSDDQKEFALMMRQLFMGLIQEFKRWEIGHRVKYGTSIDKIYLMGGTAQITGIDHFLTAHTGIKISILEPIQLFKNDHNPHEKNFFLVKMMAIAERTPGNIINFLTGKFQNSSNSFISLHSSIFLLVRTTFIALLILTGLLLEKYFVLLSNEKVYDNKILATLKQAPALSSEIPKRDQKDFKKFPDHLLKALIKKNRTITQEVNAIMSSQNTNAVKPLVQLSRSLSVNPKISLVTFHSENLDVKARFTSTEYSELQLLEDHIKAMGLGELKTQLNRDKNELNIEFRDRE